MQNWSSESDQRLPLYQRLADEMRREVTAGRWRPGERAPSENELAGTYWVAPGTARRALRELVDEGLLESIRGKGAFVRRPNFDRSLQRFFRFRPANDGRVIPDGKILRREREPAPSYIASQLRIREGEGAVSISRLRLIDDEPVLHEEIWVAEKAMPDLVEIPAEEIGPLLYAIYETKYGQLVTRANEELTAESASAETARHLKVPLGATVIVIDRLALGYDGQPIEWRRSRGRADQYHYQTEVR